MSITEDRVVNGRNGRAKIRAADRIAAFAKATEAYAESLDDPELANVYWGKSLGLWQAVAILAAEAPPGSFDAAGGRGKASGRACLHRSNLGNESQD